MNDPRNSKRQHAVLMLVLATLYWGVSFPVIKAIAALNHLLIPDAGSWFLAAATLGPRFLLAALLLLVFTRREGVLPRPGELRQGVGIGLLAAGGTLFQTDALQFTDASTSSFLTQLSAILIPVSVALRRRRNPGAVIWFGCTLVLVGVAILGHFDWRTLHLGRGEWETLLCSVFFTLQILLISRKGLSGNRPGPVTLTMFVVQAMIFMVLQAATAPRAGALLAPWQSPAWLGLTAILTLVCTVGAFSLMNRWQPKITSTEAGLIYCIEPLFASAFALFLPTLFSTWAGLRYANERATWSLLVGGGLITGANVVVQLSASRSERGKK